MNISEFKIAGLRGATPAGGWSTEIQNEECIHTLILLRTEEGTWGLGSVFTHEALVRGAMEILWPFLQGENALEPDRVTEKLHQNTFWMGRGGSVTHTISGIDMALWDILGKAVEQPVGRLLGGRYRESVMPYASLLMEEPASLGVTLAALRNKGFKAFKIGWGPFGRVSDSLDEEIVKTARSAVGSESLLMVDAGASDAFWGQNLKWALQTAQMLARYDVTWFEEPLLPDALHDYQELRASSPVHIAGGEV
jgi:D-galactarolactone cycloisomerase